MVVPIYVYLTKTGYFLDEQRLFRFKRYFLGLKVKLMKTNN